MTQQTEPTADEKIKRYAETLQLVAGSYAIDRKKWEWERRLMREEIEGLRAEVARLKMRLYGTSELFFRED